ncbi:hypothetical protein GGI16_002727 [Coemansia sp. S142-1]|nr:hypothetical protein GGI16_002727 [Coemansia sp. S142-1]
MIQPLLLARLEASQLVTQTPPESPADTEHQAMDIENETVRPKHSRSDDDDSVEPLSDSRLNTIKQGVRAFKSTWADLHEQYPPGQSDFAPLGPSAVGMKSDFVVDEAYSQAATMAAYGVEILQKTLNRQNSNNEQVEIVVDLLATLCATLIDTRDKHRVASARAVKENVDYLGTMSTMDLVSDSESESVDIEPSISSLTTHESPMAESTLTAPSSLPTGDCVTKKRRHCPEIPMAQSREEIVRQALLRQGQSESDVTAYFNRLSKSTNLSYNHAWKRWVAWCIEQGLDPVKRSDAHLVSFSLETTTSAGMRTNMKAAVRLVWSIIEGNPPPSPAKGKQLVSYKSGSTVHDEATY